MPRVSTKPPEIAGTHSLIEAVRNRAGSLREKYVGDPIGLAEKFGLKFPEKPAKIMQRLGLWDEATRGPVTPGISDLLRDVCTGEVESAVAVANRGGGKSQTVSFIEFFLVFMKDFDALNLGGSELQAQGVYNYIVSYIEHDKEFQDMVRGDPQQSATHTKKQAWIRVLTASQKSVRSPHAGGRKRNGRLAGGLLVIDEEAEAAPEIVDAALFTINTAVPSVSLRVSTFHNLEGSFKELVENHEEMGYTFYNWDIFDVSEKCDCVGKCQSEEICFREDHIDKVTNPDTGKVEEIVVHRAYCGGRSMYADGWIPPQEIVKAWRRGKRNHATWEVEAMGSRPSSKGFVIKDMRKYETNIVEETGEQLYKPGYPVTLTIDWGSRAAGINAWQEQQGQHVLIHSELLEEGGLSQTINLLLQLRERYKNEFLEIAADIGGGGAYNNPHIRESYRVPVRDVNFAELKESAVAAMNIFSEAGEIKIPKEFLDHNNQARNWKRKDGRIQKGNDHLMDSDICYFAKFVDQLGLSHIKVPPRGIKTESGRRDQPGSMVARPAVARGRVSATRTIGGSARARRR